MTFFALFPSQSTSFSSALIQNPEWDEVRALRRWFSTVGAQLVQQNQTNALSAQRQGGQCQRGRRRLCQREHCTGCGASNLPDCPHVRLGHCSPSSWPLPAALLLVTIRQRRVAGSAAAVVCVRSSVAQAEIRGDHAAAGSARHLQGRGLAELGSTTCRGGSGQSCGLSTRAEPDQSNDSN